MASPLATAATPDPTTIGKTLSGVRVRVGPGDIFDRGTLADIPLAFWLIHALDTETTGTLLLHGEEDSHRLHMRAGVPIAVESPQDVAPLCRILLRMGDKADLIRELDEVELRDESLLEALVGPEAMRQARAARNMLRATALFTLGASTRFELIDLDLPHACTPSEVNPLALIARGLRRKVREGSPTVLVHSLRGRVLAIDPRAELAQIRFEPAERAIVQALRVAPRSLESLVAQEGVTPQVVCGTVYLLWSLRFLRGGRNARPPVQWRRDDDGPGGPTRLASVGDGPPAPAPSGPRLISRPPVALADDAAIRPNAVLLSRPSGPLPSAALAPSNSIGPVSAVQVSNAPETLRRRLLASLIPTGMSNAPESLRPVPSAAPAAGPRDEDDDEELSAENEAVRSRVRAERAVRLAARAEELVEAGEYGRAERLTERAIKYGGDQPEYQALLAWCQARVIGTPAEGEDAEINTRYRKQLQMLRQVLRDDPRNLKARFWAAQVLRWSGRVDDSLRQLQRILQLSPHHIAAARELRLHEMRVRNAGKGLLGRIFR